MQVRGNNLRRALSKLKKQLQEDNKLEIFKSKQYYEKPSEKKRRKKMEGTLRAKRKQEENTIRKGKY